VSSPFRHVRAWRAADKHTGIAKARGIPYTYEHVPSALTPLADVYRIETFIPFVPPTPIHRNVHYVPGDRLDVFFDNWDEHAETVVDIRPLSLATALADLEQFRQAASTKGGA
jgi:hypothetical protein